MPKRPSITVLLPQEGESWSQFLERARKTPGELLFVLSERDEALEESEEVRKHFLKECAALRDRLRIATKQPVLIADARKLGMRVLDRTKYLRLLLQDHGQLGDALRAFSPHLWRQQLKVRLQRLGLLSIPRLRIGILFAFSALLFLFVVFRLLPSAEVRVKAREEPVTQTMNVLLVQSGAVVEGVGSVRRMPLVPLTVRLRQSLTSNSISKDFIGTSAAVVLTVLNTSDQQYSLRKGTRFTNQAGMIFRLQDAVVNLIPGREVLVRAEANDLDLYGQIIGDRGNVPTGLRWEIPGLAPEERMKIYGENRKPAVGGTTAYRTVLRKEDLDLVLHRLEQQLHATAKERVEEERIRRNAGDTARILAILAYPELTKAVFSGAILPKDQLGKSVASFTVEQSIAYTALSYDAQAILDMLRRELVDHVRKGKELMAESLSLHQLDIRVISYDDDLAWVKITVELVGKDRFILDPLTPAGAIFGKRIREKILGLPTREALRIIKNMPEIEDASVALWPPWQRVLPHIPSNISISPR